MVARVTIMVDQQLTPTKIAYREAFRIYVEAEPERSVADIAIELGLHPHTLSRHASGQNWVQHRASAVSDRMILASGVRANIAARTDAFLAGKVETWIQKTAKLLDSFVDQIATLPIDGADDREKRFNLRQGIELTNEALKGVATLVETGRNIGLVVGPRKAEHAEGKMDLSKLTALNALLSAAQREGMATKQAEALTIEPSAKAPIQGDGDKPAGAF